ncbi:hypothetical protein MMC25_000988 [Agyrium rufum]|nr:hypothetical protein [Agyrium rufum]
MTDLLQIIPDFPIHDPKAAHLISQCERHLLTTTDLLALDLVDVSRRTQIPFLDLQRFVSEIVARLQRQLAVREKVVQRRHVIDHDSGQRGEDDRKRFGMDGNGSSSARGADLAPSKRNANGNNEGSVDVGGEEGCVTDGVLATTTWTTHDPATVTPANAGVTKEVAFQALRGERQMGRPKPGNTSPSKRDERPSVQQQAGEMTVRERTLHSTYGELVQRWNIISLLDKRIDKALGGGIPAGYITEITGESGVGKTQFLLTLLLSAQLLPPHGFRRPTCYISTEHPLPTTRLSQLLSRNEFLLSQASPLAPEDQPSLKRILTMQVPDLETQEHILTYQLPILVQRHNIGLVVIDSIAANFRAETHGGGERTGLNGPQALADRSTELIRQGHLLRNLAREYDCAVVVSNQVADRFAPIASPPNGLVSQQQHYQSLMNEKLISSSPLPPASSSDFPSSTPSLQTPPTSSPRLNLDAMLSLDHQQCFFTGWGDAPPAHVSQQQPGASQRGHENLRGAVICEQLSSMNASPSMKTPALGLIWANQIACRIALIKEPTIFAHATSGDEAHAEWTPRGWRRYMRVVFAPWAASVNPEEKGVEYEITPTGIQSIQASS